MTVQFEDDIIIDVAEKKVEKKRQEISINEYMERYRSGHNEAVLKTVCPQGRVGSNPTLSVLLKNIYNKDSVWRSTQEAEGAPLERE